jgi:hypothetical protein
MDFLPRVDEIVEKSWKTRKTIDNSLDNSRMDLIRIDSIRNRALTLISTWMVSVVVRRFGQFLLCLPLEWRGNRSLS